MKTIVALLLGILITGCVRIGVERPVGTPVKAEELKQFEGVWLNNDGGLGVIALGDAPSQVKVTEKKKTGDEKMVYEVTAIDGILFAWSKPDDLDAYLPGRIISSDPSYIVALIPDEEAVKDLVASGRIKGHYLKDKDAWILSPEGIEAILTGKDFWTLETALTLIRKPAQEDPEGAPAAAPTAGETPAPESR